MYILFLMAQALAGWLLADLLSGIAHWLEDRVISIPLPFKSILKDHHADPDAFLKHGLVARNALIWSLAATISLPLLWALGPHLWLLTAMAGGAVLGEVHRYAHVPRVEVPRWLQIAQRTGVVASPAGHNRHHRNIATSYCLLTDWLNWPLDRVGAWRRLERLVGVGS